MRTKVTFLTQKRKKNSKKKPDFQLKSKSGDVFYTKNINFVTRLGFEPKTPTLKVLCSTN